MKILVPIVICITAGCTHTVHHTFDTCGIPIPPLQLRWLEDLEVASLSCGYHADHLEVSLLIRNNGPATSTAGTPAWMIFQGETLELESWPIGGPWLPGHGVIVHLLLDDREQCTDIDGCTVSVIVDPFDAVDEVREDNNNRHAICPGTNAVLHGETVLEDPPT